MNKLDYDLIVIGAGPGGYVAAIRASQLGLKTAVVEKDKPGGVCLNWGCIPSKSLIHQAGIFNSIEYLEKMGIKVDKSGFDYRKVYRKSRKAADTLSKGVQFLINKNNIEYISGNARFVSKNSIEINGEKRLTAKNFIIATGSRPKNIPGFEINEKDVVSSTGILGLETLPRNILILGAGAIGVEFAYILNSFGVEVHLVEMMSQLLPLEDEEVSQVLYRSFKRKKINMYLESKAESMIREHGEIKVRIIDKDGGPKEIIVEKVLSAVGRIHNSDNLGLEEIGVGIEKGAVIAGDYYQTGVPGIYAIGDVIASAQLAHVASKEGEIAVEHMAGHNPPPGIDPLSIPGCIYCEPQVASFGLTEKMAAERNIPYKKAVFPYRGAGKSVAVEDSEGLVKIIYDPEIKEILGAHIIGRDATEIIHEILLARDGELIPEDIADMIHAHPTLSEAVMESAKMAEGRAIHV